MISPVKVWRNQKFVARMIGRTGKVVSWTIVRVPPANFGEQAPYPVVIVEFANGDRCTAQMVDFTPNELRVGQRVITVVRRTIQSKTDAVIPYGIKVKPLHI
jgi:uncharacterized OB-fold protein